MAKSTCCICNFLDQCFCIVVCDRRACLSVVVVVASAVLVVTLSRTIMFVIIGQAPVTLEWRNTSQKKPENNTKRGIFT